MDEQTRTALLRELAEMRRRNDELKDRIMALTSGLAAPDEPTVLYGPSA